MIARVIDGILLTAALVGLWFAWETARERSRLEQTHARLLAITGDLPIGDPTRVHVRAVETGEPLHFAWRIHVPANDAVQFRYSNGGFSSSGSNEPEDFVVRVRFRETSDGQTELYTHFSHGSSRSTQFDPTLTKLLHGRWGEIRVEQLGSRGVAVPEEADRPVVLLRLTLPEDLQDEARKVLPEYEQKRVLPVLYELILGTPNSSP